VTEPAKPRWASVREAHDYLHAQVSERTLRRWIADGRLTGHRLGPRRLQIDLNELDALRAPIQHDATTRERNAQAS
jgi:excisionase family DNA binding protein